MDKWNRLKELYQWKIENIESNPEPSKWDLYDKKHYEHTLKEMERIDKYVDIFRWKSSKSKKSPML